MGGRDARISSPRTAWSDGERASLDAGEEPGLLLPDVPLEQAAEDAHALDERLVVRAGGEDAAQLDAEPDVLLARFVDARLVVVARHHGSVRHDAPQRGIEDRLFAGHVRDELLGDPRDVARARVPPRLGFHLVEQRFDGPVLGDEDFRGVHRSALLRLSLRAVALRRGELSVPFHGVTSVISTRRLQS